MDHSFVAVLIRVGGLGPTATKSKLKLSPVAANQKIKAVPTIGGLQDDFTWASKLPPPVPS